MLRAKMARRWVGRRAFIAPFWSLFVPRNTSYRSLVRIAGPGLLVLTFLARLPAAMAPLGVIMLVSSATHSFAQAGLVTAALGVGAAAGGPAVGWLTDRSGQRVIGAAAAVVNALALAATVGAVSAGAGVAVAAVLAAVVGVATPQVGPLIRVRWAALLPRRGREDLLPTAMAYEGAADEASFVAGPALVGLLAVLGVPALPLIAAVGLGLAAALPFALHRTAEPAVATRSSEPLPCSGS
jgi:MFS family permease